MRFLDKLMGSRLLDAAPGTKLKSDRDYSTVCGYCSKESEGGMFVKPDGTIKACCYKCAVKLSKKHYG